MLDDDLEEVDYDDSDLDSLLQTPSEEKKARELLTSERALTFEEANRSVATVSQLEIRVATASDQLRSSRSVPGAEAGRAQQSERTVDRESATLNQGKLKILSIHNLDKDSGLFQ